MMENIGFLIRQRRQDNETSHTRNLRFIRDFVIKIDILGIQRFI